MIKRDPIERFNEKVKIVESGCHEWTARLTEKGYGSFKPTPYKSWQAHRWIYHYYHPETPIDLYVLHKCDNRKCVNLDHLYSGTQFDNMRDMWSRNRGNPNKGENHHRTSFTNDEIKSIKGLYLIGLKPTLIAKAYKSRSNTIWSIVKGKVWEDVPFPVILGSRTRQPENPARGWRHTKKVNMLSLDGSFIRSFTSEAEAARFLNRCSTGFREVIKGRQHTWGGYKWEYALPKNEDHVQHSSK